MIKHRFSKEEKEQFKKKAAEYGPKRNMLLDVVCSFVIGGIICMIGQGIGDASRMLGVNEENIKTLVPCALIILSCILTGFGLYSKIAKYAGAGTLVPITGFANAISSIAIDSKAEGLIFGVGANMFKIAGPVIVYGTLASTVLGVIYYFIGL